MKKSTTLFTLLLGLTFLSGCDTLVVTPHENRPDLEQKRGRLKSIDEITAQWSAYTLATQGKFEEARLAVERGEDTQAHYEQGVRYYNYWSVRTARRDANGKPDPSMGDTLHDINEDRIRANEEELKRMERQAAQGNQEAQIWVDQYKSRIKAARIAQDAIEDARPKAE